MRVLVDYDRCQSNAACTGFAPQVEMAVRSCPTGAISLEED